MTYAEFKQTDLHTCLTVAGELMMTIGKVAFKTVNILFKALCWLAVKTYRYVMK
ncbi:hypothetical protein [Vibrio hyugaensis]|uniref:Uncharacterized protein n=1 Tax=Vibrio hyugaensis TaxID=1534743 RepID=A0ABQ5Y9C2_9VIBR|nr:hypothetical protein [Vibrio hyugaensis]GLR06253.1 hypothetical protein GCM10007906_38410 [Vibrio hyugaensis]